MDKNMQQIEILKYDMEEAKLQQLKRVALYMEMLEEQMKEKTDAIIDDLVQIRKNQGITQQDIAEKVGVRAPNITRFEKKKSHPSLQFLSKYADALGYQIDIGLSKKDMM